MESLMHLFHVWRHWSVEPQAVNIPGFAINPHLSSPHGQQQQSFTFLCPRHGGGRCTKQTQLQNLDMLLSAVARRVKTKLLSVKWCTRFDTLIRDSPLSLSGWLSSYQVRHLANRLLIGGSSLSTLLTLIAYSSVLISRPLGALLQCHSG